MDVVYMGIICILKHLKEELVWAIDKPLRSISNITLFKTLYTVFTTKELWNKAILN